MNPVILAEISATALISGICATAIHSGDRPSQVLGDVVYFVTMPLRRRTKSE